MQAMLIDGESNRDAILSGAKKLSIREGHRLYSFGSVLLGYVKDEFSPWAHVAYIHHVIWTTLDEVKPEHLKEEGYDSLCEAVKDLSTHYPDINPQSKVTVVRWRPLQRGDKTPAAHSRS